MRYLVKFRLLGKIFCSEGCLDRQGAIDLAGNIEGYYPNLKPVAGFHPVCGGWTPIATPANPTADTRNLYDP